MKIVMGRGLVVPEPSVDERVRTLARVLNRAGWEINELDVNAHTQKIRIRVTRHDGLEVTFVGDKSRASMTRDKIERETVKTGRRGDSFRAERIKPFFLGRDKYPGMRIGMRFFANYLADNAMTALPRSEAKNALGPFLEDMP